ncbi:kelch-like protein 17 isoform X2 [Dysidea avara]|uniref:kelch-like protein 17 isoform X2 n=1 Tax=Dysidea avara TaxID=196820 RepID=UPI0033343F33
MANRASSHTETVSSSGVKREVAVVPDTQDNAEVLDEPSWCCEVLSYLLQDPSTHNVMFVTSDGGSVSGHKAILTASSPVFRAMFNDNVHTSGEMEISLPSVDAETLSSLVSYIYTGKMVVNPATCLDMLGAAMHFKITSLVTKLVIFATASLDSSNVISVAIFACARNCCQLLDNCLKYMCANASEVVHHPGFIKLPHEVVLAFCKSSDLNVSEIDLFLVVNEWQQHNQKVAKAVIKNIFREIRYPLISNNDLVRKVAPTKIADPSLYTTALEYHVNTSNYRGPSCQLVTRKYHKAPSVNIHKVESCAVSSSNLVGTEDKSFTNKLVKSVSSAPHSVAATTTVEQSASTSSSSTPCRKKRRRCRNCEGCKAAKCGVCVCCTQPSRKSVCIKRICSNLQ